MDKMGDPIDVSDVDPMVTGDVHNLRLGIYELTKDAVSAVTIEANKKKYGYHANLDYTGIATLVPIYNRLKNQIRAWAHGHIRIIMVATAQQQGLVRLNGKPVKAWDDLIAAWSEHSHGRPPSRKLTEQMTHVLFGHFNTRMYWNETYEKEFMTEFNWSYTDADRMDTKCHLGKGKGAKLKSSIAQLIAVCKSDLVKEVNRRGSRAHGLTLHGKRTREEKAADEANGMKRRKKPFVYRTADGDTMYDLTDLPDNHVESSPDDAVKQEPSGNGMGTPLQPGNIMGSGIPAANQMVNSMGTMSVDPATQMVTMPMAFMQQMQQMMMMMQAVQQGTQMSMPIQSMSMSTPSPLPATNNQAGGPPKLPPKVVRTLQKGQKNLQNDVAELTLQNATLKKKLDDHKAVDLMGKARENERKQAGMVTFWVLCRLLLLLKCMDHGVRYGQSTGFVVC